MERFTLYVGLNDKDTKTQKIETLEAYKVTENILKNLDVDGATIFNATGLYKHQDGTSAYVSENTLRIELLFITFDKVKQIAQMLKNAFNQESIAYNKEIIESELL